jgi:threonine aldolase
VCLNPTIAKHMPYLRKQGMQLASKMRFISAQFVALLSNDLWRQNALHANAMAQRLLKHLNTIEGINVLHPVQANGVFVQLPMAYITPLQQRHHFYVWDSTLPCVRWMTAFDTTPEAVDTFADDLRNVLEQQPGTTTC